MITPPEREFKGQTEEKSLWLLNLKRMLGSFWQQQFSVVGFCVGVLFWFCSGGGVSEGKMGAKEVDASDTKVFLLFFE